MMKKFLVLVLTLALALTTVGCAAPSKRDLMKGVQPLPTTDELLPVDGENAIVPADFAVRLFQASFDGEENTMLAPVSVLFSLGMTANGAKGDTLAQMEDVFGMTVSELNSYKKAYWYALPEDKKCKLHMANSIWFTNDNRFTVEQSFLQTNATYYDADIYQAPMGRETLESINVWVEDHTDGMIKDMLQSLREDTVMCLVNAMSFEAEWRSIYEEYQISDGVFTTESGEAQTVEMMHANEHYYLDDGNAIGFIKPYAGDDYAFVALLPKEGMSVSEYADTLTGEGLAALLAEPKREKVITALPKFQSEYSVELKEVLEKMGMTAAFSWETADFTGLGSSTEYPVHISQVCHKTFITVDSKGTKAGAGTVVMAPDSASDPEERPKEVILDRPFVYMIIDCQANLPLFMGTVMSIE